MRWGYTEEVLGDLHWLAELAQPDELLLRGIYGLTEHLEIENLPRLLQRPLSEKEQETLAWIEERNRNFKSFADRIRDEEQLLTDESPEANVKRSYHGLDYLAVRTDLPDLCDEDLDKIKNILHHISASAKLDQHRGSTLENFCIENLIPWVAKYDSESYADLACDIKLNALNQKWAQFKFLSIQALIFKSNNRRKITEAILGMKERLAQGKDFRNK